MFPSSPINSDFLPCDYSPQDIEALRLEQAHQDWSDFLLECRIRNIDSSQQNLDAYLAGMLDKIFPMDRYAYHRKRISLTSLVPLESREITLLAIEAVELESYAMPCGGYAPDDTLDDLPF
jgi:hypothetical protein